MSNGWGWFAAVVMFIQACGMAVEMKKELEEKKVGRALISLAFMGLCLSSILWCLQKLWGVSNG